MRPPGAGMSRALALALPAKALAPARSGMPRTYLSTPVRAGATRAHISTPARRRHDARLQKHARESGQREAKRGPGDRDGSEDKVIPADGKR